MLLIHWSKQNNTSTILKNGIKPKMRKTLDAENNVKGVWCYPFTRNKSLNNNWKQNLKSWRKEYANFNGFVFKLEESDFPIYAGDFALVAAFPHAAIHESMDSFLENYGKYFSPKKLAFERSEEDIIDYQDFEIIIPKRIESKRIIKIIKDRKIIK